MATRASSELQYLHQLRRWWRIELDAARVAQRDERWRRPWAERLAAGKALTQLSFVRREPKRASATLIWFGRKDRKPLPPHRVRSGFPALVWPAGEGEPASAPTSEQRATVVRVTADQLLLRFPNDYDRFVETGTLNFEHEESEVTFQRGDQAVQALESDASARIRALLFGDAEPQFDDAAELSFRDAALNPHQRLAVERAVRARDAVLVHGPPGTGKTRTLVEIVRQGLLLGRRILVTAASNVAVDNLTRRLSDNGVKVLRLGARKKVAPDLAQCTLQHKLAELPEMAEAQKNFDAAQRIADGKGRRPADPKKRIGELRREAHALKDAARAKVLRRSRIVCATAGGVDAVPLGDETFDMVVLDEATQAPDPVALSALERGGVLVLAGDPEQLPPTVVTQDSEANPGLSSTLFERCAARWPGEATTLLAEQYRMPTELMQFPSQAHYGGKLEAAAENRHNRLQQLLPKKKLKKRDAGPWIVVDTSALGHSEAFDDEHSSYYNDPHRKLVAAEVKRLVDCGIDAGDIAAICPYSAQVRRLRTDLAELLKAGLEIGTVDGFQGREKEVVIVDLLRSNAQGDVGFLRDIRRTNVAITRAKRQLIVIVHGDTVSGLAYYRKLLAAAKAAGALERAAS
ncbi:MAG TPA: AAA domain-containing protein [Polyangiaceae bacterium]|nr:AAA domain-containing protein [Polyangiaceae bacterium]